MDNEKFYFTISLDSVSFEETETIIQEVIAIHGSRKGMRISYDEAID